MCAQTAIRERQEADEAKAIALKERAEADAAKEEWRLQLAKDAAEALAAKLRGATDRHANCPSARASPLAKRDAPRQTRPLRERGASPRASLLTPC